LSRYIFKERHEFLKEKSILAVTGERDRACNGASFLSAGLVRGHSCCWSLCVLFSWA